MDFSVDFDQGDVRDKALVDIFRVYTMLCGSPHFSLAHVISATPYLRFVDLRAQPNRGPPCFSDSGDGSSGALTNQSTALPPGSPLTTPLSVNFLHLVQFGEVNGLIRRIHCFPISDHIESMEPTVTATGSDVSANDGAHHPLHITRAGHMVYPGQPSVMSSIHSGNESPPVNAAELLDEKTWNTVRSSLCDGLHSVDDIGIILSQQMCQFGTPDTVNPSGLVAQLRENLVHRLQAKSSRDPVFRPSQTTVSHNSTSSGSNLPVGCTQPPPPHPATSRLRDPGFKLVSTSTDEPISHSRVRLNPLNRQAHHLQRRVSSIPQGYSTGELRFLVEKYAQDEKLHNTERKPNRHHSSHPQGQSIPVSSLYLVWR